MCNVEGFVYMYMVIESGIDTCWSSSLADLRVSTGKLLHEGIVPVEVLSFYSLALIDTKADSERESVPSQGHGETQEEVTRFNLDDKS